MCINSVFFPFCDFLFRSICTWSRLLAFFLHEQMISIAKRGGSGSVTPRSDPVQKGRNSLSYDEMTYRTLFCVLIAVGIVGTKRGLRVFDKSGSMVHEREAGRFRNDGVNMCVVLTHFKPCNNFLRMCAVEAAPACRGSDPRSGKGKPCRSCEVWALYPKTKNVYNSYKTYKQHTKRVQLGLFSLSFTIFSRIFRIKN